MQGKEGRNVLFFKLDGDGFYERETTYIRQWGDSTYGWDALVDGTIEICYLEGGHLEAFATQENINVIARRLSHFIKRER